MPDGSKVKPSIFAVVPARGGSKGFPGKNVAEIGGRTLLELAVGIGVDCSIIDEVYVTTDVPDYEALAVKAGARTMGLRDPALATDTARTADVVVDLIGKFQNPCDYIVLLQPTSPVRSPADVDNCVKILLENEDAEAVVSVSRVEEPHPRKMKTINGDGFIEPLLPDGVSDTPRQLLEPVYRLIGAVYVIRTDALVKRKSFTPAKSLPYVMDGTVNIDTEHDFLFLQNLYDYKKIKIHGTG